jgi:hypothetical protein
MNQKLEASPHLSPPAANGQHVGGPHFERNRNSSDAWPDHPNCAGIPSDPTRIDDPQITSNVLVTVLMPCLNEARTLAACIQQAHAGCQAALARRLSSPCPASGRGVEGEAVAAMRDCQATNTQEHTYEILIADNGSTDGSSEIAVAHGARVVHVEEKGYGAALRGGITTARGKYIVMGDSDCSYDFGEVPRFLDKLEEGYDLVIGNRFAGGIMAGAMPWHHRFIGNPFLSRMGRILFHTLCRDWHCGLRAFDRKRLKDLQLKCGGMEFASEMIVTASKRGFSIAELSVCLYPDGRNRAPHLRSLRDGFRHLAVLVQGALPVKIIKKTE